MGSCEAQGTDRSAPGWSGALRTHLFITIPLSHITPGRHLTGSAPYPPWQLSKQTLTQGTRKIISSHDVMKLKPPF